MSRTDAIRQLQSLRRQAQDRAHQRRPDCDRREQWAGQNLCAGRHRLGAGWGSIPPQRPHPGRICNPTQDPPGAFQRAGGGAVRQKLRLESGGPHRPKSWAAAAHMPTR
nr:MAG TPA: hypothetical protein [Caudoviricetes sp.]